mmetsp:Transcript_23221/g.60760  ORF Transcript_23221/g.60760 Transcript_23221/m.60760 type:complete len:232 (-) Transcript_23221:40-735(-)
MAGSMLMSSGSSGSCNDLSLMYFHTASTTVASVAVCSPINRDSGRVNLNFAGSFLSVSRRMAEQGPILSWLSSKPSDAPAAASLAIHSNVDPSVSCTKIRSKKADILRRYRASLNLTKLPFSSSSISRPSTRRFHTCSPSTGAAPLASSTVFDTNSRSLKGILAGLLSASCSLSCFAAMTESSFRSRYLSSWYCADSGTPPMIGAILPTTLRSFCFRPPCSPLPRFIIVPP